MNFHPSFAVETILPCGTTFDAVSRILNPLSRLLFPNTTVVVSRECDSGRARKMGCRNACAACCKHVATRL